LINAWHIVVFKFDNTITKFLWTFLFVISSIILMHKNIMLLGCWCLCNLNELLIVNFDDVSPKGFKFNRLHKTTWVLNLNIFNNNNNNNNKLLKKMNNKKSNVFTLCYQMIFFYKCFILWIKSQKWKRMSYITCLLIAS
jgi:Fe-S-cluster formation regulator IscX/YfhJ